MFVECADLTATRTTYPGTDLTLVYAVKNKREPRTNSWGMSGVLDSSRSRPRGAGRQPSWHGIATGLGNGFRRIGNP